MEGIGLGKKIELIKNLTCTGCSACANICPVSAIKMVIDERGFYKPEIDLSKCVDCGLCDKTCPILNECKLNNRNAIGIDIPLSIYINSDKGYIEPDETLYIECTPKNIIKDLNLLNICYEEKARFGHFQD